MKDQYICPMHPEVVSDKEGRCPKCGMKLILKSELHKSSEDHSVNDQGLGKLTWKSYLPLLVIVSVILTTALFVTIRDVMFGVFSVYHSLSYIMIGFFLVFGSFKLMDLKGFAEGYATYDLLASRWSPYGYIYPFIELFFGFSMILDIFPKQILLLEIIIMGFSGIGVLTKLLKKEQFQCACLGTFLKVPLTKITVVEDFSMVILALTLLFLLS